MSLLDFQKFDAKIKIHYFSLEESSSSRKMLPEPLLTRFKINTHGGTWVATMGEMKFDKFFCHFWPATQRKKQKHEQKKYGSRKKNTLGQEIFRKQKNVPSPFNWNFGASRTWSKSMLSKCTLNRPTLIFIGKNLSKKHPYCNQNVFGNTSEVFLFLKSKQAFSAIALGI